MEIRLIEQLGHVCLGTSKLKNMIDYYVKYCNCSISHEFINQKDECYGVMLRVATSSTFIELFQDNGAHQVDRQAFRHLSFQVSDINEISSLLPDYGSKVEVCRGKTDRILQCWHKDPDGNNVEFTQFDNLSLYKRKDTEIKKSL
jgi:catechol 2,3-dioxygenase-like lactoylglutathione lyase family enzyme